MTSCNDLASLLADGGDERLHVDAVSGRNRYGCASFPCDEISFGSSTASSVSAHAHEYLASYWAGLGTDIQRHGETVIYGRELEAIRHELRAGFDLRDTEIVIAPSGTDLHLFAALLWSQMDGRRLLTLTLGGNETGSAVPVAAQGRHFAACPNGGAAVEKERPLDVSDGITTHTFSVRDDNGRLRAESDIEDELSRHIEAAQLRRERALLVVADVSKTGLIAPGLDTVLRLRARFPEVLEVMIDACQLRLGAASLRAYLEQNFLVAITGSKFLAGPVFSGALLVPKNQALRLRHRRASPNLSNYSCQADWPRGWAAHDALPERANFGLVLRWRAALLELDALSRQPADRLRATVAAAGQAIDDRLRHDSAFVAVEGRPIDRSAVSSGIAGSEFDDLPTIFPFYLQHPNGGFLTPEQIAEVYRGVACASPGLRSLRLGQPVAVSPTQSALRLCLSAPMLAAACESPERLAELVAMAGEALDRVALFTSGLSQSSGSAVA